MDNEQVEYEDSVAAHNARGGRASDWAIGELRAKLTGNTLTPREEFEREFGEITDGQWDWLKDFVRKHNGFVETDPPQWNYNEYTQRDEYGNWWVIGLPGGPRKLEAQERVDRQDHVGAVCNVKGCFGQMPKCSFRDRSGVERSQARANPDN